MKYTLATQFDGTYRYTCPACGHVYEVNFGDQIPYSGCSFDCSCGEPLRIIQGMEIVRINEAFERYFNNREANANAQLPQE